MAKPKIAFFDFAGCEGDQLQVANLEEKLLDVLDHVEVVNFREVMTERSDEYDIAFVEGSITRPRTRSVSRTSAPRPSSWWPWGPAPPSAE
jgi:coenzyme F420-reducing hydrogenase gamma subunit